MVPRSLSSAIIHASKTCSHHGRTADGALDFMRNARAEEASPGVDATNNGTSKIFTSA